MNITKYYKIFRKNRIVLQYFAVLAVLLLVPVLLSFFVINAANDVTKQQIEENTYQSLIQIKTALDRDLLNIRDTVLPIAQNSKLNLYSYEKDNPQNLYILSELVNLSELKSAIKDIVLTEFIYIKSDNIIISGNGKFTAKEYFDYCRFEDIGYNEWLAGLEKEYKGEFLDIEEVSFGENMQKSHVIEYRMSYPIAAFNKGTVVMMLDYDKMYNLYVGAYSTSNKTFFIADGSGNLIMKFGDRYEYDNRYNDISPGYTIDSKDKSTMLFKVSSDTMNINYLAVVELSAIKEQEHESRKVISVYMLLVVVFCGIFAAIVARKASLPVIKIYKMIHKENNKDMNFDGLTKEMKRIIDDKKRIEQMVERQEETIQYQSLLKLVMGQSGTEFEDGKNSFKKYFKYDKFMVLIIDADIEQIEQENQAILKYAVKNIAGELFGVLGIVYAIDIDRSRILYIFNFNTLDMRKLHNDCEQLAQVIENEFEAEINIGSGAVYNNMSDLNFSYNEAKQSVEYSKLSGESVIEYDKMSSLDTNYYYSVESENAIIRNLINGDKDAAMRTVEEVINMHKGSSPAALKCLFFHIMATLLSLVNNKNFKIDETARDQMNMNKLFQCESVPELKKMISGVFDVLIACVPDSKNGKRENFKSRLLEYTDQNFCDNSMSLDMVATQFNVHPTYISHFFKEFIGENFSDYIAMKRIEKAKVLLAEDYSLSDVANMVGYANSAVLIKKFKKIVGLTPGEYRRNNGLIS